MEDILIRLQNQPKVNGAHPKDIEDAIQEIDYLRKELNYFKIALEKNVKRLKIIRDFHKIL